MLGAHRVGEVSDSDDEPMDETPLELTEEEQGELLYESMLEKYKEFKEHRHDYKYTNRLLSELKPEEKKALLEIIDDENSFNFKLEGLLKYEKKGETSGIVKVKVNKCEDPSPSNDNLSTSMSDLLPMLEQVWGAEQARKFMNPPKEDDDDDGWIIQEVKTSECLPDSEVRPLRKFKDPGEIILPVGFGEDLRFPALLDSGAGVNTMPVCIFRQLGIKVLTRTGAGIQYGNQEIRSPIGLARNLPVRIHGIRFHLDFFIMDLPPDVESPIVLGRGFLRTARMVMDFETASLVFKGEFTKVTLRHLFDVNDDSGQPGIDHL